MGKKIKKVEQSQLEDEQWQTSISTIYKPLPKFQSNCAKC